MCLGDRTDDGSDRARRSGIRCLAAPPERLEDAFRVLGRDAVATVVDPQPDDSPVDPRTELYAVTVGGVFRRIVGQLQEILGEPVSAPENTVGRGVTTSQSRAAMAVAFR